MSALLSRKEGLVTRAKNEPHTFARGVKNRLSSCIFRVDLAAAITDAMQSLSRTQSLYRERRIGQELESLDQTERMRESKSQTFASADAILNPRVVKLDGSTLAQVKSVSRSEKEDVPY